MVIIANHAHLMPPHSGAEDWPEGDSEMLLSHLDFCGITDQHTLHVACAPVLVGGTYKLEFDVFPLGLRIQQQAAVIMHSQHQPAVITLGKQCPRTRRQRQTALGIELD